MPRPPIPSEPDLLARVNVRLLEDHERERFDLLLKERHYLHSAILVGQHLRYVAELDGQWVALIAFSAASLHIKGRDKRIGWSARQRARRLSFIANNSRFLVLTDRQSLPNLASRVLGLCLRRLSDDWLARWKHPILAVESFVDETLYRGTCYRACGFEAIGPTGGFSRNARDYYLPHGQPKQLYLRALHPRAFAILKQARLPESLAAFEADVSGPCPFQAPALDDLLERFRQLPDSRKGHGLYHRQRFVLGCAAVATLMGACGYRAYEDTCSKFTTRQLRALGCFPDEDGELRAPSDSTFRRVLMNLDPGAFAAIVGQWLLEQEVSAIGRLAVDGKVLRGSGRRDGRPLQLLSAVTHHLRLSLGQVAIDEKSNEIPALQPLLESLALPPGVLITADALHCQQNSARFITQELGGDYLFGLKGNQEGAEKKAEALVSQRIFPPSEASAQWEKHHDRLERRRLIRIAVTPEEIGLVGCWQVVGVRREFIPLGKGESEKTDEVGLYLTSCALEQHTDAEMMEIIRGHWSAIENGTHYRRDVSLGEDACRVRDRVAASVLASLRNLAIGVYELERHQERTKADSLPSWRRSQSFGKAMAALKR